jgi:hypothetical protein
MIFEATKNTKRLGTRDVDVPSVNKFLVQHKKFGPARNILRPVKGQGIYD